MIRQAIIYRKKMRDISSSILMKGNKNKYRRNLYNSKVKESVKARYLSQIASKKILQEEKSYNN